MRSKSATRSTSSRTTSRSRTQSRDSKARSRSKTPTRKIRTPASEPRTYRRDSDSSDQDVPLNKPQLRTRVATPKVISGNSINKLQNTTKKIDLDVKESQDR